MKNDVFAFGYTGRKLPTLVQNIKDADAVLVDIRYSPRSRVPTWNRRTLEDAFGDRYVWAGDTLGNRLYRTDSIQFADLVTGMALLLSIAEKQPVAVMCVCEKESECHRRVIVAELEKFGLRVFHHPPASFSSQPAPEGVPFK